MNAQAIHRVRPRPAGLLAVAFLVAAGTYVVAASGFPTLRAPVAGVPVASTGPGVSVGASTTLDMVGPDAPSGPSGAVASSQAQIDHSIRAWSANLRANDKDFYSATNLGILYQARGRLTGDVADYARAREALDRALAIEPAYGPARTLHAVVLQATHDFTAALAEARRLYSEDARQLQALATVGDAQLELGDYTAAAASYEALERKSPGAAITARLAHLASLRGESPRATTLARRAYVEARDAGTTGPGLGWYAYLAGTIAFQEGKLTEAARWLETAATDWPDSYLVLAGRARVAAATGKTDAAIELYRKAIAIAPQPDALAALGDMYAIDGRRALAEEQYATVGAIARLAAVNRQVYNRQLALFEVNHGVELTEALLLAENELRVRKDVYGYDAYAWALLANGRASEADSAMAQALSLGTRDAQLLYHAGLIAKAVGDPERARAQLTQALALNPGFDPLQAVRATTALQELAR